MKDLFMILNELTSPETINEINLPEELLDPNTKEEKEMRFSYIFHELFGKCGLEVSEKLGRSLTINEIGVVNERLQSFLIENGF